MNHIKFIEDKKNILYKKEVEELMKTKTSLIALLLSSQVNAFDLGAIGSFAFFLMHSCICLLFL